MRNRICSQNITGIMKLSSGFLIVALLCGGAATATQHQSDTVIQKATSPEDEAAHALRGDATTAVRHLTNRDPLLRQRAAEELARLAAADQRKLVEGYRLQEKNERVKLALDWALYRMGKTETLFAIVRALDSSTRHNQAYAYLTELEGPAPLYMFLTQVKPPGLVKLLEVLARTGDDETLNRIEPYAASPDAKIADAAQFAAREITRRLTENTTDHLARPRKVGSRFDETSP